MHRLFRFLLPVVLLLGSLASMPVQAQAQANEQCFAETGFCVSGRLLEFWQQNGGLFIFGLPITPQREEIIEGRPLQVQWFERNRLELHPENPRPYDVLVGRLGAEYVAQQVAPPREAPNPDCRYFEETGYNVCEPIYTAWGANGLELDGLPGKTDIENLALFGLPLTGAYFTTLEDGNEYLVQWFERARFEIHPDNLPPANVLLGLLGREAMSDGAPQPQQPAQPVTATARALYRCDVGLCSSALDGSATTTVIGGAAFAGYAFAPDGARVALGVGEPGSGIATLYRVNPDGGDAVPLFNVQGVTSEIGELRGFGALGLTPDNNRIIFEDQAQVFIANLDNSNRQAVTEQIGYDAANFHSFALSPQSSRLMLIRSSVPNMPVIYDVTSPGSQPQSYTIAADQRVRALIDEGSRILTQRIDPATGVILGYNEVDLTSGTIRPVLTGQFDATNPAPRLVSPVTNGYALFAAADGSLFLLNLTSGEQQPVTLPGITSLDGVGLFVP